MTNLSLSFFQTTAKFKQVFHFAFIFLTAMTLSSEAMAQCSQKNEFTITYVDCKTIIVEGNPTANSHEWNFGQGWFTGNAQETYTFPCNGNYTVQHTVEAGFLVCELPVVISCGEGFTIEEDVDACLGDFACFRYISNYCPSDQLIWDFGDGNTLTCTDCATVQHCYTNVNTNNGTNTLVTPTLTVNGQIFSVPLDITDYDVGIFIGKPGEVSLLTGFNAVLPGASHNGNTAGSPVYVYGTVEIDKSFSFSATDIFVERSGGLNVKFTRTLTLQNSTAISSTVDCPCLWRGIDVHSGGKLVALQNTKLSEALYATRAFKNSGQNPIIGLKGVLFGDNYIGFLAEPVPGGSENADFTFDANSGFTGNTFSSAQVKNWCGGGDNVDDAFGPSGGVFFQDRGWAGVYLREVNNFQVPIWTTTAINQFNNLANGIYMLNSSAAGSSNVAGIWNCQFDGILRGGYPVAIGGYGIFFSDEKGGHTLSQQGLGTSLGSLPTFSNCEVGILGEAVNGAFGTSLQSHDNLMQQVEVGYRIDGITGDINARITENEIHSDAEFDHYPLISAGVWIEDRNQQSNGHVVDNNVIVVDQPNESFGFGVFIRGDFDMNPVDNSISVGNNVNNAVNPNGPGITINWGTSCVHIIQYSSVDVHNNVMLAQQGTLAGLNGTLMFGGLDHDVRCNEIQGPVPSLDAGNQNAINSIGSLDPVIIDNHLTNFDNGMIFDDPCGFNVNFSCNDLLGTQNTGLFYSDDAITGTQFDRGNEWLGTYNQWGAFHDPANSNLLANQYRARTNPAFGEFPPSVFPLTLWFIPGTIAPDCPADPECAVPPGELKELNSMDSLVAQGEIEGLAGIIWSTNKYLYGRLKDNPSLLEGNSLMQSFVSAHENMPLGQFYTIGKAIETFYQIDSATQVLLNANQHVIEANLEVIETIDEELASLSPGPQYDSLLQQRQELTDEITQLTDENAGIYQDLHDARVQQADALLSINSAISTTEIYETNEKEFFDVYLQTIAKDNGQVTPTQLTTLENIASQCPAEGGRAVYWAIGLHGHLDGGLLEIQECGLGGRSDDFSHGEGIKQANSFTLYPNPSSGDCKLVYELGEDNEGKILVADQFGREVKVYQILGNTGQLILDNYPSGFYLIQLLIDGQIIQSNKLIRL